WASGHLHDSARHHAFVAAGVTAIWFIVAALISALVAPSLDADRVYARVALSMLPLSSAIPAIWALRSILRWTTYGDSNFVLSPNPGEIGGIFGGILRVSRPPAAGSAVKAGLQCLNRIVTRSGNDSSVSENILWHDEDTFNAGGDGSVTITFPVDAGCRASDDSDADNQIIWRLACSAPGSLVAYAANFEVPVFTVDESPDQVAKAKAARSARNAQVESYSPNADSAVRITSTATGGTEFYFPPGRNVGPAAAFAMFGFAFGAFAAFVFFKAPIFERVIFVSAFGLFAMIALVCALAIGLGFTRVSFESGEVSISKGLVWIPMIHYRIPWSEIGAIHAVPGMSAGHTAYSQLRIDRNGARSIDFADGIADRREAEWTAIQMSRCAGIAES
ncbi:MAG TPA: hypothetical protein VMT58_01905, partial [Candidatus Binataceae bacterium]|nr:hypothetical protein [Candidatus Binataceae bacterium]